MEEVLSFLEEDFTCPICCEVFKNPVALKCSHSLCEGCLQQYWSDQKVLQCPVCRKECSAEEPTKNLAFKNLCENFRSSKFAVTSGSSCPEHNEMLKLYCYEDKQPICVVCYTSKKHENHKCSPVVEAIKELKENFLGQIESLKVTLDDISKVQKSYEEDAEQIMHGRQKIEDQIKIEFEKLHQFLREEEESRINVLRKREKQKTDKIQAKIDKLSKDILALSETIAFGLQEMEADNITFLKRYTPNLKRFKKPGVPTFNSEPKEDETQYLQSLLFTVWARMQKLVTKAPVTMDPNTASAKLVVSEDMTSLSYVQKKQALPDNPERLYVGVLGSQGFSSGVHCWDVEVGNNYHWTIGVVKQSIQRKKLPYMEPSRGFWCIRFGDGKYWACLNPLKKLKLAVDPWIIRVQLDFEKKKISCFDPFRNITLYTFENVKFTEAVFPYFCTGRSLQTLALYPANKLS